MKEIKIAKLEESKFQFIETWSLVGIHWGMSRVMAQIHALLLVSSEPMNTDDIMNYLSISRGSTSMNVRALIDWRLVAKKIIRGQRVEYFVAEKDIWKVVTRILTERRKRELEPLKNYLMNFEEIKDDTSVEYKEFRKTIKDIDGFVGTADKALDKLSSGDKSRVFSSLMKFILK